jgi:tripartite-type tricarboxylate transporter receptor subunit TctC
MPARVEWLPDVPTIAESGFPGFDSNVWYMLMAPPGLPAAIAARLAAVVGKALRDPVLGPRVQQAGFVRGGGTPADAGALLKRDAERYAALIRAAGVTLE